MPSSPLPPELKKWFNAAKRLMELSVSVHFIRNEDAKKIVGKHLIGVGALGHAYGDGVFSFIESDIGRDWDREVIVHEMMHLKYPDLPEGIIFDKKVQSICDQLGLLLP